MIDDWVVTMTDEAHLKVNKTDVANACQFSTIQQNNCSNTIKDPLLIINIDKNNYGYLNSSLGKSTRNADRICMSSVGSRPLYSIA